jgi:hypothetical protein
MELNFNFTYMLWSVLAEDNVRHKYWYVWLVLWCFLRLLC